MTTNIKIGSTSSVADPGCLLFIPDPKKNKKEEGEKFVVPTFLVAISFTKLKLFHLMDRHQQTILSIDWIRELGSGKKLIPDPDPGVKKNRIVDPDSQHCENNMLCGLQPQSRPSQKVGRVQAYKSTLGYVPTVQYSTVCRNRKKGKRACG